MLLLDNGNIINAVQEANGSVISGQDAVKLVTEKAKEKDGSINVYYQTGDMVTMLASVTKCKAVYENLSTEFTSLEALIGKLQNEDHTGFIEVKMNDSRQTGYIFLLAGDLRFQGPQPYSGTDKYGRRSLHCLSICGRGSSV
ncbi:MAG: hypothetical protein P8Y37_11950 [Anaerolineales bacterium]